MSIQLLLTKSILEDAHGRANTVNALNALLQLKVIPIVNENDTTAFDEIVYGDNDALSAIIAVLPDADGLILLSDIDDLYERNPRLDSKGNGSIALLKSPIRFKRLPETATRKLEQAVWPQTACS